MRKRSDANSAASSPPVPARISTIAFLSSAGSRGSSASPQLAVEPLEAGREPLLLLAAELALLVVGGAQQRARVVERLAGFEVAPAELDDGLQPRALARERGQPPVVGGDIGVAEQPRQLGEPRLDLLDAFAHAIRVAGDAPGVGAPHAARGAPPREARGARGGGSNAGGAARTLRGAASGRSARWRTCGRHGA